MSSRKKIYSLEDADNFSLEQILEIYRKNINPNLVDTISKLSFAQDKIFNAQGQYIYTKDKKRIIDFTGGYGVLSHGHNHPRIIKSRINFQKNKKMEVHKNYFSPYMACLSNNIANLLPHDLNKVFLPNSGAEANEGAIKMAYKFHNAKKKYLLHSDISFHGKLLGSGSISNTSEINFKFPGLHFKDQFNYNNIESLTNTINKYANDIYAIIIEPLSASTLRPLSKKFASFLRKICTSKNIVLIFDEVFTSWAKTGKLFYFEYLDVIPDILTFSKSFGGGKSSISGYVARDKIFNGAYLNRSSFNLHSSTYNGFGEECITAIEAINIIIDENYIEKANKLGSYMSENFKRLSLKFSDLRLEPRGVGALQGFKLNLSQNYLKQISKILPSEARRFLEKLIYTSIVEELYDQYGILTTFSTNKEIVFWISPPLCTNISNLKYFFKSLDEILHKGIIRSLKKLTLKLLKRNIT